jgi:hypothetical protein
MASNKSSSKTLPQFHQWVEECLNYSRVSDVDVDATSPKSVVDVVEASWNGCCKSLDVTMYHTSESHALRSHDKLYRRQDEPDDATPTSSNNIPIYTLPEQTATSTESVTTLDLSYSADSDQKLIRLSNSTLLSCKNCSTFGTLDFSLLSFSLQDPEDILGLLIESPLELGGIFQGGELEIVANGMGARVELLTNVTGNDVVEVPLFVVPLRYGILVSQP